MKWLARIQLEDVALALLFLVGPLLSGRGSAGGHPTGLGVGFLSRETDPLLGIFAPVVAVGAIAVGSSIHRPEVGATSRADRVLRGGLVLAAAMGTAWTLAGAGEILT